MIVLLVIASSFVGEEVGNIYPCQHMPKDLGLTFLEGLSTSWEVAGEPRQSRYIVNIVRSFMVFPRVNYIVSIISTIGEQTPAGSVENHDD